MQEFFGKKLINRELDLIHGLYVWELQTSFIAAFRLNVYILSLAKAIQRFSIHSQH